MRLLLFLLGLALAMPAHGQPTPRLTIVGTTSRETLPAIQTLHAVLSGPAGARVRAFQRHGSLVVLSEALPTADPLQLQVIAQDTSGAPLYFLEGVVTAGLTQPFRAVALVSNQAPLWGAIGTFDRVARDSVRTLALGDTVALPTVILGPITLIAEGDSRVLQVAGTTIRASGLGESDLVIVTTRGLYLTAIKVVPPPRINHTDARDS